MLPRNLCCSLPKRPVQFQAPHFKRVTEKRDHLQRRVTRVTKGLETIPEQEWLLKGPEIQGPKKRNVRECIGSPTALTSRKCFPMESMHRFWDAQATELGLLPPSGGKEADCQ